MDRASGKARHRRPQGQSRPGADRDRTTFFDWDEGTYNSYFNKIPHAVEVVVPKLSEMACEKVELSAVPFATFIADKTANGQAAGYSFVLRGSVRHWLNAVFAEYDRVRLTDILDAPDSAPKLRSSAKVAELSPQRASS
jgi:hypothetical protein